MPRRGGRTVQKNPTEAVQEYIVALENKDRPQWSPEKLKEMADRFKERGVPYHVVRQHIVEWLRGNVPDGMIPNYLRFGMAAYKMAKKGTPRTEMILRLAEIAEKNALDVGVLQRMFQEVDDLKNIEIDWDALAAAIQAVRARAAGR